MNKSFSKVKHTLLDVAEGETVKLSSIQAGAGVEGRLAAMGFFVGTPIKVMSRPHTPKGPLLVRVGNSRLILGRGMAGKLIVEK